ncbi:MAG TPA: response regulator [Nitrospirales bacterium]|jgi:CheY-like chemotaxis protein
MTNHTNGRPMEILLVEDNPGDVRFTSEVLKEAQVRNNLSVAKDGVEAIAFLRREGQFLDAPRPDLILLDLNLPKKNGLEMLNEIKNADDLKAIPVVILTTSEAEQDINKSFDLSANCYITKPIDVERLTMVMNSIKES